MYYHAEYIFIKVTVTYGFVDTRGSVYSCTWYCLILEWSGRMDFNDWLIYYGTGFEYFMQSIVIGNLSSIGIVFQLIRSLTTVLIAKSNCIFDRQFTN